MGQQCGEVEAPLVPSLLMHPKWGVAPVRLGSHCSGLTWLGLLCLGVLIGFFVGLCFVWFWVADLIVPISKVVRVRSHPDISSQTSHCLTCRKGMCHFGGVLVSFVCVFGVFVSGLFLLFFFGLLWKKKDECSSNWRDLNNQLLTHIADTRDFLELLDDSTDCMVWWWNLRLCQTSSTYISWESPHAGLLSDLEHEPEQAWKHRPRTQWRGSGWWSRTWNHSWNWESHQCNARQNIALAREHWDDSAQIQSAIICLLDATASANPIGMTMEVMAQVRNVFQRLWRRARNRNHDDRAATYRRYVDYMHGLMNGDAKLEKVFSNGDFTERSAVGNRLRSPIEFAKGRVTTASFWGGVRRFEIHTHMVDDTHKSRCVTSDVHETHGNRFHRVRPFLDQNKRERYPFVHSYTAFCRSDCNICLWTAFEKMKPYWR